MAVVWREGFNCLRTRLKLLHLVCWSSGSDQPACPGGTWTIHVVKHLRIDCSSPSPCLWQKVGSWVLLNNSSALQEKIARTPLPQLGEHIWLPSSGTGGLLKIVAISRRSLELNALAVNELLGATQRDTWLNPLPLFHVAGVAMSLRAYLSGAHYIELLGKWSPHRFIESLEQACATLSAAVPTQLFDLVAAGLSAPKHLRALVVGGGALDEGLHARAVELGWPVLRSYGMTEAASQIATETTLGASSSGWLPLLSPFEARTDQDGVLELRGPCLLTGMMIFEDKGTARWVDPKRDGWFRTSDRAELRGRELRVLGRVDDMVKIRGELVDVGALQTALQARVTEGRLAVRCLPDKRNGAALCVVAENSPALQRARALQDEIFPPFARPREFVKGPVEVTALGKTIRHPASFCPSRGA